MRSLLLIAPLLVAACAPSPLYVARDQPGTPGEIPRDATGEPIWDRIPPPPPPGKPAPPILVEPGPPIRTVPPGAG